MVSIYKGKVNALECNALRRALHEEGWDGWGIKLSEYAMKVFEQIIEAILREKVDIDEMQFGIRAGISTTDAIFIVRQKYLQEKYLEKKKSFWMASIDQ